MKTEKLSELASVKPDLADLREDFDWCVNRRDASVFKRLRQNRRTRNCEWPGQSDDGRKWQPRPGEDKVRPWSGASDTRPHMVDTFINEDKALLKTVWRRNRVIVSATESNDLELATRLTGVLRWMKYTQMREFARETDLLANWMLERGTAVLAVFWDREWATGSQPIDLETLAGHAMEAQKLLAAGSPDPLMQQIAEMPRTVMDPSLEEQAVAIFRALYEEVPEADARRVIRELRTQGESRFNIPYVRRDLPTVVALAVNEDIFIDPEAASIQQARSIHRIEQVSEAILRERVRSKTYSAAFVEEVIRTQKGKRTAALYRNENRALLDRGDPSRMFEIIHTFRRLADQDGTPGIYYTCWAYGITENQKSEIINQKSSVAWHGLLNYDHGDYPFVLFERERRSRVIDDARGIGEIAATWQDSVKAEWDARRDRNSLATVPPRYHPPGRPPSEWGPGAQLGTHHPADYGYFETPKYDIGSKEFEMDVRDHANRYFGRANVDEPQPIHAQLIQQERADDWMAGHVEVDTQILKLMQQFMPEEFYYRVVGSVKAPPIHASRQEIQGSFDVSITFDVGILDSEKVKPMMELIQAALTWDLGGRIDRDELVAVAFEMFAPNLAERILKGGQEAAASEVADEADAYAQIFAGVPVDIKPGQAYQLRLQWWQEMLKMNQTAQARMNGDEYFKELVEKRIKQLSHQVEQFTVNAQIGRLGA